jgi:hypothetical protein
MDPSLDQGLLGWTLPNSDDDSGGRFFLSSVVSVFSRGGSHR